MEKKIGIVRLSLKSMIYNKRKSVFTILTVSLAVCLMMVILQYLYSSRQREVETAGLKAGDYHAEYRNVSEWQLKKLAENRKIGQVTQTAVRQEGYDVRIVLKSDINCRDELRSMENTIGLQENQIHWNVIYLDAADIGMETLMQAVCILAGLVLCGVIVIYNIFYIYMDHDIRLFGIMRAIGFEAAQLKRFVRVESAVCSITGSLAGLLMGAGVSGFLIPVLGNMENNAGDLKVYYTFGTGLFSFLAGICIVFIGIQKPLKTASKITVMEANAYYAASTEVQGKIPRGLIGNKISIWDFSKINLFRNWKKNGFVMLSLVTTGVLFLIAASIIKSMDIDHMISLNIKGDYSLQISESEGRNKSSVICLPPELLEEIKKQKGVTAVNTIMYDRCRWKESDAEKYMHLTEEFRELGIGYDDIDSVIYGYDDMLMEECLQKLEGNHISLDEMKEENLMIVIDNGNSGFTLNDTIHLKNASSGGGMMEFKVIGILKNNITYRGYTGAGNDLIVHQSRFEAMGMDSRIQRAAVSADSERKEQLSQYLRRLIAENEHFELTAYDDLMEEYEEQKNALATSSYSLLILLFCIAVFNLMNTSLSNIFSRKRDLGMLEAIGLTGNQENRMLQTEGLLLALLSAGTAVLLGIPAGYAGFWLFSRQASYAVYKIPLSESAALVFCFAAVQSAVIFAARHRLRKESIMEKMENEDL